MREGKRIRTEHLDVRVAISPLVHSAPEAVQTRVGLIVPRYRQSAVDRNRLKRRLRELVRHLILPARFDVDIVLRARPEAYRADFDGLQKDVDRARVSLTKSAQNTAGNDT